MKLIEFDHQILILMRHFESAYFSDKDQRGVNPKSDSKTVVYRTLKR